MFGTAVLYLVRDLADAPVDATRDPAGKIDLSPRQRAASRGARPFMGLAQREGA